MKKVFSISLTIAAFFFCFSLSALAKTSELTCNYNVEVEGDKINILCSFYDNYSNSCYINSNKINNNAESIVNWGVGTGGNYFNAKEWYKNNKKCLPYVIFVNKHAALGYEIYAADTYDRASIIASDRKTANTDWDVYTLTSMVMPITDYQDKVRSYINLFSDIGKNFGLKTYCSYKNGKYTINFNKNYTLCRNKMQEVYNKINEADEYVQKLIDNGTAKTTDPIIQEYYAARNKARNQFSTDFDEGQIENPENPGGGEYVDPGGDLEYSTTKRMCISCGNGALKDIPSQLPLMVRNLIKVLQLLVPVILIILGIVDFIRAVVANDEKMMTESQNRFIRRVIAAVLVFLTVAIVRLVFSFIDNNTQILGCVPCFVSDSASCGAEYTCPSREADRDVGSTSNSSSGSTGGGGGHAFSAVNKKIELF